MNIRLCGSFLVNRKCDSNCTWFKVTDFLAQLPKHCFVQTLFPVESLDVVFLVYTIEDDFDFDLWFEQDFEM